MSIMNVNWVITNGTFPCYRGVQCQKLTARRRKDGIRKPKSSIFLDFWLEPVSV